MVLATYYSSSLETLALKPHLVVKPFLLIYPGENI